MISDLADIETSKRGSQLLIHESVVIDAFVKIKFVGGEGNIVISEGSYINSGTVIYSGHGVEIGKHCLIAANCTFAPVNHSFQSKEKKIVEQRFLPSRGGIWIGDDVWIGAGSVILDGAKIGKGAVIGALSLIRGEVEPYSINVGNPLTKIGERR